MNFSATTWDGLSSPSLRLSFAVQQEAATSIPASDDPIERRAIDAVKHGDAGSYEYLVAKYMKRAHASMPAYAYLSEKDLKALQAYLTSLP